MSNTVSPAQVLPSNVLHLIIQRLVKPKMEKFGGVIIHKVEAKELLFVCSTWRQVALEYLWRELNLTINPKDDEIYVSYPKWAKRFKLPVDATNLVKELHLNITWRSAVNGMAHKLLAEYMGNTKFLPLVHKLSITLTKSPMKDACTTEGASSSATELSQLLQSVTRDSLTTAEILCKGGTSRMDKFVDKAFGMLAKTLFIKARYSKIDLNTLGLKYAATVENIPQLSSLSLNNYNIEDVRTTLIHRCATTLQELDLGICIPKTLIYDANDNAIVYPNMRHLRLYSFGYDGSVKRIETPSVVPFPALRSLQLIMPYPFADDILFRGNCTALQRLRISIDKETAIMLSRSLEFANGFKKLRIVSIHEDEEFSELGTVGEVVLSAALNNITSSARVLRLSSSSYVESLITTASHGQNLGHIRVLDLGRTKVSLFKTMCLLRALPGITKLACVIDVPGSELSHINSKELPDYMVTTYKEVGNRLQCLYTRWDVGVNIVLATTCVMILALVCPKLCKVESLCVAPPVYYAKITKALGRKPFAKYASQLKHLLDGQQQ